MQKVVRSGTALATPQLAHSIHVEVDGLQPDRWYWYRFRSGDATSAVGRARTMPEPSVLPERLRFAFASCQHYETGLYTAYEHMAKDELDLVISPRRLHLRRRPKRCWCANTSAASWQRSTTIATAMRSIGPTNSCRPCTLRCPWVVAWDDHEFENNYAGAISEREGVDPAAFLGGGPTPTRRITKCFRCGRDRFHAGRT